MSSGQSEAVNSVSCSLAYRPLLNTSGRRPGSGPEAPDLGNEQHMIARRMCRPRGAFEDGCDAWQRRGAEQSLGIGRPFPFIHAGLGEAVGHVLLILR